jgi:predicted nucleotidyltransferase
MTDTDKRERDLLLRRVRKAAGVLKDQFGARQVILFGSLAGSAWYGATSDIDLAVEGLKGGKNYWQAWRAVEEIVNDRLVDLIEIEDASESLRQAIQRYGIEL